jgi:hypothetical protein
MSMQFDVWAVNAGQSDDTFFSTNVAASGTVTLAANQIGNNGTGYKVSATSAADDSSLVITVTGIPVGRLDGGAVTESFSGGSASVTYSTNYYNTITAISVDKVPAGSLAIGFGGDLALPRTRIKSVYYVAGGASGNITFTSQISSTVILGLTTPSATLTGLAFVPPDGILTTKNTVNDFCVVTTSNVGGVTIFCG